MRKARQRVFIVACAAIVFVLFDASAAMAQIVQSEVDAEPGSVETTQLVTSSTEVRRAVLGLLALAFVAGVLTIVYWYKTGQQARQRFMRRHGGRHLAGQGAPDVVGAGGHPETEGPVHFRHGYPAPTYAPPTPRHAGTTPTWQPVARHPQPTWPSAPVHGASRLPHNDYE